MSMRVMSAGEGYRYLLKSVVTGDGNRDLTDALTRYYQEKGSPPGSGPGQHSPASKDPRSPLTQKSPKNSCGS